MKYSEITNLSSLFHTDWHPESGDYDKENSVKEGKLMVNKLKRHKIVVWFLSTLIFVSFTVSIFLLSI